MAADWADWPQVSLVCDHVNLVSCLTVCHPHARAPLSWAHAAPAAPAAPYKHFTPGGKTDLHQVLPCHPLHCHARTASQQRPRRQGYRFVEWNPLARGIPQTITDLSIQTVFSWPDSSRLLLYGLALIVHVSVLKAAEGEITALKRVKMAPSFFIFLP